MQINIHCHTQIGDLQLGLTSLNFNLKSNRSDVNLNLLRVKLKIRHGRVRVDQIITMQRYTSVMKNIWCHDHFLIFRWLRAEDQKIFVVDVVLDNVWKFTFAIRLCACLKFCAAKTSRAFSTISLSSGSKIKILN